MRKFKFVYAVLILAAMTACEKANNTKPDKITFEQVNKTVTLTNSDSISGACQHLVFSVAGNAADGFQAYISSDSVIMLCDGSDQFLVYETTNQIKALGENTEVSEHGTWKRITWFSLDQFAGKGEKYVGYRILSFPDGNSKYYYGWIKLELSAGMENLKIINRATNYTEFNPITTGQVE